jgi:hypothetical protein
MGEMSRSFWAKVRICLMINFRSHGLLLQEMVVDLVQFLYLHVGYSDLFVARAKAQNSARVTPAGERKLGSHFRWPTSLTNRIESTCNFVPASACA